jgi:hypothetical protein
MHSISMLIQDRRLIQGALAGLSEEAIFLDSPGF